MVPFSGPVAAKPNSLILPSACKSLQVSQPANLKSSHCCFVLIQPCLEWHPGSAEGLYLVLCCVGLYRNTAPLLLWWPEMLDSPWESCPRLQGHMVTHMHPPTHTHKDRGLCIFLLSSPAAGKGVKDSLDVP